MRTRASNPRENQRKSGVENVEFLKGEIENIPLPDNSVDVVISNCVINLSCDKDKVLREAWRVLKPGGRLAVSDVVVRGEAPEQVRRAFTALTTPGSSSLPRRNRRRRDSWATGGKVHERLYPRCEAFGTVSSRSHRGTIEDR